MKFRPLGSPAARVSSIGLGCMGMSIAYGAADEKESLRTLDRAAELGVDLLDTADVYGVGANEALIGRWLSSRDRDTVFVSTKFGLKRSAATGRVDEVDTSAAYVPVACEASLTRLKSEHIDLYYMHRRDPAVPIEDSVGAMAALVEAGKVRFLGLSEVSPQTLRRAHAVHPVAAIQLEYSLFTRDVVEGEMLATCRELGVAVVAYSPLGRGMLGGALRSREALSEEDNRRRWPRFAPENIAGNLALVEAVRNVAGEIGCSPAQAALAWLLAQGPDVLPIPGTKRRRYLEENVEAAEVILSDEQVSRLRDAVPTDAVAGGRYPDQALTRLGH
ncbi:aldo/keto reductase [Streptomyces albidus (ex Kaewkla and Franco 2022)]|uniref:aldo/keto reductase n=1 Tax=Streptomyces albidus (ex Kaewkla and Franco 2022) TaxID=722709 RepID=UPI0015EED71E|nr:aldo/keto reductase [Streptomyces albidus (ex Kaewkla and Franco 2022)]